MHGTVREARLRRFDFFLLFGHPIVSRQRHWAAITTALRSLGGWIEPWLPLFDPCCSLLSAPRWKAAQGPMAIKNLGSSGRPWTWSFAHSPRLRRTCLRPQLPQSSVRSSALTDLGMFSLEGDSRECWSARVDDAWLGRMECRLPLPVPTWQTLRVLSMVGRIAAPTVTALAARPWIAHRWRRLALSWRCTCLPGRLCLWQLPGLRECLCWLGR